MLNSCTHIFILNKGCLDWGSYPLILKVLIKECIIYVNYIYIFIFSSWIHVLIFSYWIKGCLWLRVITIIKRYNRKWVVLIDIYVYFPCTQIYYWLYSINVWFWSRELGERNIYVKYVYIHTYTQISRKWGLYFVAKCWKRN